jgi:hypothetical protein
VFFQNIFDATACASGAGEHFYVSGVISVRAGTASTEDDLAVVALQGARDNERIGPNSRQIRRAADGASNVHRSELRS